MTSLQTAKMIAGFLEEKLGENIKVLEVEDLTILADYFVIASGSSSTQVRALADEVEHKLGLVGVEPRRVEGKPSGGWVLLDYNTVILHVFSEQAREFYSLERLWADAKVIDIGSR